MKKIKPILIYILLILIIPLLTLSVIYLYNQQKENIQTDEITEINNKAYENRSILIKTRNMLINKEFNKSPIREISAIF